MEAGLYKKLMLQKFKRISIENLPKDVNLFHEIEVEYESINPPYDLIISFCHSLEEMRDTILCTEKRNKLTPLGYLYLAYPKKSNRKKLPAIERDRIFPFLEVREEDGFVPMTSLKFSKMVSLDENYTIVGLKIAKKEEAKHRGQKVEEYEKFLPQLLSILKPDIKEIFENLTPGYQRNWARYLYSPKMEETKEKRLKEMEELLRNGYKSIDLYRKSLKAKMNIE